MVKRTPIHTLRDTLESARLQAIRELASTDGIDSIRFLLMLFNESRSYRSPWLPSARNSRHTRSKSEEEANSLWISVTRYSN
jgi:hypothetical protein